MLQRPTEEQQLLRSASAAADESALSVGGTQRRGLAHLKYSGSLGFTMLLSSFVLCLWLLTSKSANTSAGASITGDYRKRQTCKAQSSLPTRTHRR